MLPHLRRVLLSASTEFLWHIDLHPISPGHPASHSFSQSQAPACFSQHILLTFQSHCDFVSATGCTVRPAGTTAAASTAVPVQQALPGSVAPPPAPQILQQKQHAVPSQAAGVTGPSAAPAQACRPRRQAAKPALRPAKGQGGTQKRGSPATKLHTTGSGVSKPTRRRPAAASRQGAASRGPREAGSTWRGQTGALRVLAALGHAAVVQCGLLCLIHAVRDQETVPVCVGPLAQAAGSSQTGTGLVRP